jgi:hypothetical protein
MYHNTGKTFWRCFNRACDLTIEHPDRDAEISDYYGVLGQLAQLEPEELITNYFMQNEKKIYQKGFEILFIGDISFVVRHRHKDYGVCVALYWKANTIDMDVDGELDPIQERHLFDHDAATETNYRDRHLKGIISHSAYAHMTMLWSKDRGIFKAKGKCNAALKAHIIEWAAGLDAELPGLIETARDEVKAWSNAESELKGYIKGTRIKSVWSYNHYRNKAVKVSFKGLSIKQCRQLDKILPEPLEIQLINDKDGLGFVTTEQADQVRKLLNIKRLRVDARIDYRITTALCKQIADLLRPAPVEAAS